MATAEKPVTQRKLTQAHRLKMANLATEKFRAPELRTAEDAARQNLIDVLYRDALAVPKKELAVLRKHRYTVEIDGFDLPKELTFQEAGSREFELPNGEKVIRHGGETRNVRRAYSDEKELPKHFATWPRATQFSPDRIEISYYSDESRRLAMPKSIELPGDSRPSDGYGTMSTAGTKSDISRLQISGIRSAFMSADVLPAMIAYFVASDARIVMERRLIASAIKVLANCDVYGQVLDFWPEVAEIEKELFDDIIPNAFALVALSDEDKQMLCSNMSQRGVASNLCTRRAA